MKAADQTNRRGRSMLLRLLFSLFFVLLCLDQSATKAFATEAVIEDEESITAGPNTDTVSPDTGVSYNVETIHSDRFDVRLEYGLNGILKYGASSLITMKITNLGEDFEGTVRIIIRQNPYSDGGGVAYEKDLVLASKASKTISTAVRFLSSEMEIGVEIADHKENILLSQMVPVNANFSQESILVGVLSDDFTALNYFDGISIFLSGQLAEGFFSTSLVELSADQFPQSSSSLGMLNYLIINSFDSSSLNSEQYQAIQEWVAAGGILIIGTGPDSQRALSLFSNSFLQAQIGDAVSGTLTIQNADANASGENVESASLTLRAEDGIHSVFLPEGREQNSGRIQYDDGLSLIQKKEVGRGSVVVLGMNLGLSPIDTWSEKASFGLALLMDSQTAYSSDIFYQGMYDEDTDSDLFHSIISILDRLFDVKIPNIALYALLFFLYVLVAGPVGYLLLKAIDRREMIWGAIPGCALLFTVFIAILSAPSRMTNPVASHLTVIELDESGIAEETIYLAIQTPDTKKYEIQIAAGYQNFSPLQMGYYSSTGNSNRSLWDYRIKETAEGYLLHTNHASSFQTDYMNFEKIEDSSECSFDIQIQGTLDGFSGSVTNHTGYDLVHALICYSSHFVYIGDLGNGETISFSETENEDLQSPLYGWYFHHLDFVASNAYNLICAKYDNALGYEEGFVVGSVMDYPQDIIVTEDISESGAAIFHQPFTYHPEDVDGTYVENILPYAVKPDYNQMDYSDGMLYSEEVTVEINIFPITSVTRMIRKEVLSYGWSDETQVYAYDPSADRFDLLFENSDTMYFEDGCPYLTDSGTMLLRFECAQPYDNCAPIISLIGGNE